MRDDAEPAGGNVDEVNLFYKTSGSTLARDFYVLPISYIIFIECSVLCSAEYSRTRFLCSFIPDSKSQDSEIQDID